MKNKNADTNQKKHSWKKWVNITLSILLVFGILSAGFGGYTFARDLTENPPKINASEKENPQEPSDGEETPIDDSDHAYQFDPGNISYDEQTGISYVNNIVLIFFNDGASEKSKEDVVNSINGTVVGEFKIINQYQVQIGPKNLNELKLICNDLSALPEVLHATYDMASQINTNEIVTPDDPWNNDDWNENSPGGNNWWLEAIQAPSAWGYNDKFNKIKIGIVDNGFDTGHEDLKGNLTFPDSTYEKVNSKEDHGSHVAGIIGAHANNEKGITGIIWNSELICFDWEPTWLQAKFTDWNTGSFIAAGLIETVKSGAKVVNFSLGCSGNLENDSATFSQEWIDEFGNQASLYMASLLYRGYDFVVVQSSGNGANNQVGVDAIYNGWFSSVTRDNCYSGLNNVNDILNRIIIVGAAQQHNLSYIQPSFSNGGSQVDICAPGVKIYSTITGGISGKYGNMSGTSMSAPIVTGVCGLVWAANENLSGDQVKNIVCNNSTITVSDNTDSPNTTGTYRMVNAYLAV
ncbi:MAG: S8 family serine peptidase, partial [Clostridiales bacterium]|nr:S8 family serine peptidase [Clostridiales bacterium]